MLGSRWSLLHLFFDSFFFGLFSSSFLGALRFFFVLLNCPIASTTVHPGPSHLSAHSSTSTHFSTNKSSMVTHRLFHRMICDIRFPTASMIGLVFRLEKNVCGYILVCTDSQGIFFWWVCPWVGGVWV